MIYPIVLLSLMGAQCVTFLIAKKLKNPSIVDLTWVLCLTFFPLCLIWGRRAAVDPTLAMALSVLVFLWGARLGGHIFFNRLFLGHVDQRYSDILPQNTSPQWFYFWNFQLQGFLISLILMPFYKLPASLPSWWAFVIGGLIAIIGLNVEMQADQQLQEFKKHHPQAVCDRGLWAYSRHPNYFGELLFWFGIALSCFQHTHQHWIFISPVCLFFIFYFITGPVTEEGSIQRRGFLYTQYQRSVPFLFPRKIGFWAEVLLFKSVKKRFYS